VALATAAALLAPVALLFGLFAPEMFRTGRA
jgi:hypothetical protein